MYKVLVLSSSLSCAQNVSRALAANILVSAYQKFVQGVDLELSQSRAHAYIFIGSDLDELQFLPQAFFRKPTILLFEGTRGELMDREIRFDRVFTRPFLYNYVAMHTKHLIYSHYASEPEKSLISSDLVLDLSMRKAQYRERELSLSNKEFSLLEFLMRHPNKALTRNEILEMVWDRNSNLFTNTVDVHVGKLRKKIDAQAPQKFIQTVHGFGYVFNADTRQH